MPRQPHVHSPAYASPVLRAASPASSLGTVYPPDATSLSDQEDELDQDEFERKYLDRLKLGREFVREWSGDLGSTTGPGGVEIKDQDREGWGVEPLLGDLDARTNEENQYLHERILASLRYQVHLLDEDDLFEQSLLRSQAAQASYVEQPTGGGDIDSLMRSMMGLDSGTTESRLNSEYNSSKYDPLLTSNIANVTGNSTAIAGTVTDGPWNRRVRPGVDTTIAYRERSSMAKGKGKSRIQR